MIKAFHPEKKLLIIAGERIVDSQGSFTESDKIIDSANRKGLKVINLEIVTLAKRWEDGLSPLEFKSGASAMAAIEKARNILKFKKADLVVIKGRDFLKTEYGKDTREKYMRLYRKKYTPLDGYHRLVPMFLKHHHISEENYFKIRDALFENYKRTWRQLHPNGTLPNQRWFEPLGHFFRGVDCANPNVDYSGKIILSNELIADRLKIPKKNRIQIIGNAYTKLRVDGLESLPKIAPYSHLKRTISKAQSESKIDFKSEFLKGRAFLDAYTCYPVVPMGLLISLGLAKNAEQMLELLKNYEVTVTGGLNLGKAPWNLTSLNGLIVMRERLLTSSSRVKLGLVHGNGSLGNQQGISILKVL